MIKNSLISLIIITLILILGSCGTETVQDEEQRTIRMVYTNWSESIAINELATILLEEKLDYKVITKLTDVESAYSEIAETKFDVFCDAWLPETQQVYYDVHADKLEKLGIIYPDARTGFVVPVYSDLKTITDLKNYENPVIGIDSGAGVMYKARQAIEKYQLQIELKNLSENIMVEKLKEAVKRREPIVITGWEPHWIFARYEVRFLEDADGVFGKRENIYAISRKDLKNEHPHAVRFFERMQLSENQLNSLVYEIRLAEDPAQGARKWIKKNEYVVNQWVKDLAKKRKKIM